ncbi:toxin-antitoxin system YwqK family antitoxin [Winogradskyella immobilis]|uniref:Toxin-antitoxin system YwqK family antitoxin n=1 Tax=Winogradskyella immobilis TaxID=2816852 RepID=A0ABS8EQB8_9FLAO|nr:toxin-antitoxin system YwqK family antitoxin [Winogradskyella immobilis]MCC1485410.1 toxin-antitoxin system YwqK family antitoxin [Winogradskyella immobilis]MCG0017502.1 toxin-antitoxin system YwqK family antitoxin [Winogradskyella immobilis]
MFKQKNILIIISIFATALGFTQSNINQVDDEGKRHGRWAKYYEGKKALRYEGQFLHGKEIDTFKYYKLSNGKSVLSAIKVFNNSDNTAEVTFMASNKKVVSEGKMDGKNFIGKWVYYHRRSSAKMIVENYDDSGQLNGTRTVYYENGIVAEQTVYNNGKRNGLYKSFSENNKLLQESIYKDDKLDGATIYYDADEKVRAKGLYTLNLKSGIWEYFENGVLIRKVDHDEDKVIYKKQ